jgi:hypothetical protein
VLLVLSMRSGRELSSALRALERTFSSIKPQTVSKILLATACSRTSASSTLARVRKELKVIVRHVTTTIVLNLGN